MKKVLWIVGGLIGLLVVVALAAPFFVDLNDYKAEIAAKAKEATGRDLAIDGDISLSILPTPGVVIHGLRFGNAPGGSQPDMATLESATVKVAIMPYLTSNTVEVEEIVLEKPTFVFEKLKDGSGNWQIAPQAAAPEAGVTPEPSAAPAEGGSPMAVVIKSASIEGGTLIYRDLVAGTEQKVENLNIDLSLDSLTGPFQAEGGATVVNIPLGFRVKTGALDPTKPMPLDVSFSLTESNATIGFVGEVNIAAVEDPTKPIVIGKLSSKGDNLAKMIAGMPNQSADGLPPIMAQAFAVDADIQAGKTNARTDNFTANLGDLTAKASVAANYEAAPSVEANVAIGRIDLDKLMPAGEAKEESAEAAPAETGAPAQAGGAVQPAAGRDRQSRPDGRADRLQGPGDRRDQRRGAARQGHPHHQERLGQAAGQQQRRAHRRADGAERPAELRRRAQGGFEQPARADRGVRAGRGQGRAGRPPHQARAQHRRQIQPGAGRARQPQGDARPVHI